MFGGEAPSGSWDICVRSVWVWPSSLKDHVFHLFFRRSYFAHHFLWKFWITWPLPPCPLVPAQDTWWPLMVTTGSGAAPTRVCSPLSLNTCGQCLPLQPSNILCYFLLVLSSGLLRELCCVTSAQHSCPWIPLICRGREVHRWLAPRVLVLSLSRQEEAELHSAEQPKWVSSAGSAFVPHQLFPSLVHFTFPSINTSKCELDQLLGRILFST